MNRNRLQILAGILNESSTYKKVNENSTSLKPPEVSSFKDLFELAPKSLQEFMLSMWQVGQDPEKHPEGNTLKHIISTTNRAIRDAKLKQKEGEPFDIDSVLIAFFHDLGKKML